MGTDEVRGGLAPFLNCHGGSDPQPSRDSHLGVQYIANGDHGCVTLVLNSIHQKMSKNLYAWSPGLASGDREMNNT